MKTLLKIVLLLGVAAYLVLAIWMFGADSDDRICEGVTIELPDDADCGFVDADYVRSILRRHKVSPEGMKIRSISLEQIEEMMLADAHIEHALCYYTSAGDLCISVVPYQPVLHVISQTGENYYMEGQGLVMPSAVFNLDLCVATGNVTREFASEHLLGLARFIRDNRFWREQIQQIHVVSPTQVQLYPRVGQHVILLGSPDHYEEKLHRLRIFYREGLNRVGWNKYESISLAYDGQVVCTKVNNQNK